MNNPKAIAHSLLLSHNIGDSFRDTSDIEISQFHSVNTIEFALLILSDKDNTTKEKIELLNDVIKEIPKFKAKEK